jgi:hypothetical protein
VPPVTYRRRLCCESANDNSPLPAALDRRRFATTLNKS